MSSCELDIKIEDGVSAQVEQLRSLSSQVLEAAKENLKAAESAIGIVKRAYAYNGTDQRLMKVTETIIEKAGEFLGTVSPEAGSLLTSFGHVLLSDEIYPLAISRYLKEEGVKLLPVVSEEDLPFYNIVKGGGLCDEESKAEIGRWILGQSDWEPLEIEEDPEISP